MLNYIKSKIKNNIRNDHISILKNDIINSVDKMVYDLERNVHIHILSKEPSLGKYLTRFKTTYNVNDASNANNNEHNDYQLILDIQATSSFDIPKLISGSCFSHTNIRVLKNNLNIDDPYLICELSYRPPVQDEHRTLFGPTEDIENISFKFKTIHDFEENIQHFIDTIYNLYANCDKRQILNHRKRLYQNVIITKHYIRSLMSNLLNKQFMVDQNTFTITQIIENRTNHGLVFDITMLNTNTNETITYSFSTAIRILKNHIIAVTPGYYKTPTNYQSEYNTIKMYQLSPFNLTKQLDNTEFNVLNELPLLIRTQLERYITDLNKFEIPNHIYKDFGFY